MSESARLIKSCMDRGTVLLSSNWETDRTVPAVSNYLMDMYLYGREGEVDV
jgi:hypothetical protein